MTTQTYDGLAYDDENHAATKINTKAYHEIFSSCIISIITTRRIFGSLHFKQILINYLYALFPGKF